MRIPYFSLIITLAITTVFISCKNEINLTPENKQKLFDSIDCSEYSDNELQMTICMTYKNTKFNEDGLPDFKSQAANYENNFYILSKKQITQADKVIKSIKGIKGNFGSEIPPFAAKKLKENSVNHRKEMHNIHKAEDTYVSGYRYSGPTDPDYPVEEHVYFTWLEVFNWMQRIKSGYTLDDSQLAWEVTFGEYGTGDSTDPIAALLIDKENYKRRSTIIVKAKKIEGEGVLSDITKVTANQPETAYDLGTLYPPGNQ